MGVPHPWANCTYLAISLSFALLISLSSAAFLSALALLESFSYIFKVKTSITNETLLEFIGLFSDLITNYRTVKRANFKLDNCTIQFKSSLA